MTDVTTPVVEQPTAEEIARHYSAAMDSVALLNAGKPERMEDADWADTVKRNVEHLEIMVAKDFMQDQDLAPLQAAIAANK
jgi:dihydrodipicolinate synthase/N-acetylneuraminate lyase